MNRFSDKHNGKQINRSTPVVVLQYLIGTSTRSIFKNVLTRHVLKNIKNLSQLMFYGNIFDM